jgi:hypothetical protein
LIDDRPNSSPSSSTRNLRARNEDLLDRAETALKSYNGDYYGDEVDGCSKVVSRDVAEVIDHMNVSVLRTFVSGDRVVEFEPDNEQMEQVRRRRDRSHHRDFQRKGYQLLHDWLKEGNISRSASSRRWPRRSASGSKQCHTTRRATGQSRPSSHPRSGRDASPRQASGSPVEFRDYLVPLEEFRISPDARDPDDAVYTSPTPR